MEKKIGFIGLGEMGKWMSLNLLKAGYEVKVSDIIPEAVQFLTDQGAGSVGIPGSIGAKRRQNEAPSIPPMTMPGPKIPPDPPELIESDVEIIFTKGRASMIQSGSAFDSIAN